MGKNLAERGPLATVGSH